MKMYRQGDVLILEIPASAAIRGKVTADRILVYGEATGHAHRIDSDVPVIMDSPQGKTISSVVPFRLVHDEHDTIEIPEGTYRVIRQREYDETEIRYVTD